MPSTRPSALAPSRPRPVPSLPSLLCLLLAALPLPVSADCECGYAMAAADDDGGRVVYTDLLESDFARLGSDIARDTDWQRQAFNLTRQGARGPLGEMFAVENVAGTAGGVGGENYDKHNGRNGVGGGGVAGGAGGVGGLQLVVRGGQTVDGMVPVAEIDSRRRDLLWGTFRASMKLTDVAGTCAAFFWYFNDTQEIDMEFLSKDFNATNSSYPINLVLQSRAAAAAGYDARKTGNYVQAHLPFDPTADFHEYRIDFGPGRVTFLADGVPLANMTGDAVPVAPGHLALRHWSNGDALWSGGPPARDAFLSVAYVKAYFNSSAPERSRDWRARCADPEAPGAVCEIPELTATNSSPSGWFFSQGGNMTNNQTVFGKKNEGARGRAMVGWPALALLFLGGWALALW